MRLADDFFERVKTHLVERADAARPGWRSAVDRQLGHTRGALRKSIQRGTLRLRDFLAILQVTTIDPTTFFSELRQDRSGMSRPSVIEDLQKIMHGRPSTTADFKRLIDGLFPDENEALASDFSAPILHSLEQTKRTDPRLARQYIEDSLQLIRKGTLARNLLLPLLIKWASCQMASDQLSQALRSLLFVLEKTLGEPGSAETRSETLVLLPELVYRMTGSSSRALSIADQAVLSKLDLADLPGAAQALVIRARYLYYQKELVAAKGALSTAIHLLPPSDPFFCAGHHALAIIFKDLGNLEAATDHLSKARECPLPDHQQKGAILWTSAEINRAHGRAVAAEATYRAAIAELWEERPLQAALASIDLAEMLLEQGRYQEAIQATTGLSALIRPLSIYPIAESALLELVRIPFSGSRLTAMALSTAATALRRAESPHPSQEEESAAGATLQE